MTKAHQPLRFRSLAALAALAPGSLLTATLFGMLSAALSLAPFLLLLLSSQRLLAFSSWLFPKK